jgi:hypothetical protein
MMLLSSWIEDFLWFTNDCINYDYPQYPYSYKGLDILEIANVGLFINGELVIPARDSEVPFDYDKLCSCIENALILEMFSIQVKLNRLLNKKSVWLWNGYIPMRLDCVVYNGVVYRTIDYRTYTYEGFMLALYPYMEYIKEHEILQDKLSDIYT